jgi:hypothetical protein
VDARQVSGQSTDVAENLGREGLCLEKSCLLISDALSRGNTQDARKYLKSVTY